MRKLISYKIDQIKVQYNLDRQTATISALSSRNVSKYELLTGKNVLLEKKKKKRRSCYDKKI